MPTKQSKSKLAESKTEEKASKSSSEMRQVPQINAKSLKLSDEKLAIASQTPVDLKQQAAAKVFVANKKGHAASPKFALLIFSVLGAVFIWLGLQGYGYIKVLLAPEVQLVTPSQPLPEAQPVQVAEITSNDAPIQTPAAINEKLPAAEANLASKTNARADQKPVTAEANETEDTIAPEPKKPRKKRARAKPTDNNLDGDTENLGQPTSELGSEPKRKSLKVMTKVSGPSVDPILMAAYQAYSRGDDSLAQQQYRQVLQRDVRNVDALLGMAAIAQRQGRDADAFGWYQKVLEIEPANSLAQSGSINPSANTDPASLESHIKNMLARQPEAANLQASLGNFYAEQNQWALAQEAYFNASRFAPDNADYVFNLAVSLDQMGKPKLALKQYERALELVSQFGSPSPNRSALEARIRELQ